MTQATLMAQSKAAPNLFTVVDLPKNLTEEQEEMVAKIEKYPNLRKVTYVNIADVDKAQDRGYLNFGIPDEGVKIQVSIRLKRLEVADNSKFFAYGSNVIDGQFSELMLNKDKGLVFGTMRHDERTYIIYGIDKHVSAILELNATPKPKGGTICSTDEANEIRSSDFDSFPSPESISPCPTETSVLIMFTAAANSVDPNIFQTAINSIVYYNTSIGNSAITAAGARLFSVGTELLPGFVETNSIANDVVLFTVGTFANARRNATGADIVVLLTNAQYADGALGRVRQINAEDPNAYAIVETLSAADPSLNVFSHEVGHLFGGLHGSSTLTPAYAHGRSYKVRSGWLGLRVRTYSTVMQTGTDGGIRIPFFSNPNISHNGGVTGDANCCDVARRIGETVPRISGYRNAPSTFLTNIWGTDYISNPGTYYYEPAIVCGCAPYSTVWQVDFGNGIGYTQTTVNDAQLSIDVNQGAAFPNPGLVTISMTVTSCDGRVSTSFKNIWVDFGGPAFKNPLGTVKPNDFEVSKTANTFSEVFPSPIISVATFDYNLVEATQIKIVVTNSLGEVVETLVNENQKAGLYQHKIDVSELNPGIYFLRITSDKQSLTKKILVQH